MKRIEGFSGQYRFLSNFFLLHPDHIREWDEVFRTQFFNDYLKQQFNPLFKGASQELGIDIPNDYTGGKP